MAARRPKQAVPESGQATLTLNRDAVQQRRRMFDQAPGRGGRAQFAMATPQRTPTVSSSALRKIGDDSAATRRQRRNRAQTDRTWQIKSFEYTEQVGELGALLTLQSNVVSLCGFPVRRRDPQTGQWLANDPERPEDQKHDPLPQLEPAKPKPNPITGEMMDPPDHPKLIVPPETKTSSDYDDRPANVMRNFVGPDGEQAELIRIAAWNLFAAGEVTLLGTAAKLGILWEFLSIEELYPNASGNYVRQRGGAGSPIEALPADNYVGRLWRKSARYSDLADSQVKRVLPILQEIVTLTMMIDAIAQSRLSANMLFIPEEMSFSSARSIAAETEEDPAADPDGPDDLDDELFEHMTAPTVDQSSAARIVPLVIRGKAEHGAAIRVIELSRTFDEFAQGLRSEALERLGKGLEAPPETIKGKGAVNHWTAANIDSEFIVKHIQPIGQLIAAFLTTGYLRPMLIAYENMSEDDAEDFKIEFDPSPVIARADEAKSAMDLAEWLSDEALLSANGFTKADAASAEAIRQRRLWQLVSGSPAQFGKLLPLISGFETIDPAMLTPAPAAPPPGAPPPAPPGANGAATNGVPKTGNQQPAAGAPRPGTQPKPAGQATTGQAMTLDRPATFELLIERLNVAGDAAVARALELAGSRVVSLAQSKAPDLHGRIRNVRKANLMSMCTEGDLAALNTTRPMLLRQSFDGLAVDTRRWVAAHLEADGMSHRAADETGATVANNLVARLGQLTHDNLLTPFTAGDNGLRIPPGLVADVLEAAMFAAV